MFNAIILPMSNLNVAVVGIGNMGGHHARNYAKLPGATLVALCDKNADLYQDLAKECNAKLYEDIDQMLDSESIDAISLATPTSTHYTIAKHLLEKGIDLLVEKPIADDLEKADELIELAKSKNRVLVVGHIERFNPAVMALKEIVSNGDLGEIRSIITRRAGGMPPQIQDANVIIDLAVHDIDVITYLTEKQATSVTANTGKAHLEDREDHAEIFLKYDSNLSGFVQVNWITPIRVRTLSITGTKGHAELNYITQELKTYLPEEAQVPVPKTQPLANELSHFLDIIQSNTPPIAPAQIGRDSLDTALAAIKTASFRH